MSEPESPLNQVQPNSLEELFNQDPSIWSGPDDPRCIQIVNAFRAERARWGQEQKVAKSKPNGKKASPNLSLDDLNMDEIL
jgi:hypothetical protein